MSLLENIKDRAKEFKFSLLWGNTPFIAWVSSRVCSKLFPLIKEAMALKQSEAMLLSLMQELLILCPSNTNLAFFLSLVDFEAIP